MKKILFVGPEVSDFQNPFALKLKELGYTVDLLENRKQPRNNPEMSRCFSNILNYNEISEKRITPDKIFRYLFSSELYKTFFKTVFFYHLSGKPKIIKSLRNSFSARYRKENFAKVFKEYDVVSLHSLTPGTLFFTECVKPGTKLILSYWGSDLFQVWGENNPKVNRYKAHYIESSALQKADVVTVSGYEMERALIAKFGPKIINKKIVRLLFGVEEKVFDSIDKYRPKEKSQDFRDRFKIPEHKIKITVGYCGNTICNHLPMLDSISKIDPSIKHKVHLLVPMTYGDITKEYMEKVKQKLKESGVTYTLFDKYLSYEDLIKLRVSSDIFLIMNMSDALSQSVRESLYAGNLMISAVWLPYSSLRSANIFFIESDFLKLPEKLSNAVLNFDEIKLQLADNPIKTKQFTALSTVLPQWIKIFDKSKIN